MDNPGATGEIPSHLFECGDGLVHRFRVSVDRLCHHDMNFTDSECRIGSQYVIAMKVHEVVVLDEGLRILLFLKIRFPPLHDDIGMVVVVEGITDENLLIRSTDDFLEPTPHVAGSDITGTGDQEDGSQGQTSDQPKA